MKIPTLFRTLVFIFCAILLSSCKLKSTEEQAPSTTPPTNTQTEAAKNDDAAPKQNSQTDTANTAPTAQNAQPTIPDAQTQSDTSPVQPDPLPQPDPPPQSLALTHDQSPLSSAQIDVLQAIVSDEPPEVLDAIKAEHENQHFLWSDELHPELFHKSIQNLGGTYVGIGTDQSYLFIGWQKPSLAFAVDYDPWVVLVHLAYFAFISSCTDGDCLINAFANKSEGERILNEYYANDERLRSILEVYDSGQRGIVRRLRAIKYAMNKLKLPTLLTDAQTYQDIKSLIQNGRLRTFQANLLGDKAFAGIAKACEILQAPIATLYLSNAEQYWGYTQQFRQNMTSLTYTPNALIMRTSASKPSNADYRYSVQPASVFIAWLNSPLSKNVRSIIRSVRVKAPDDFPFTIDTDLPPSEENSEN